MKRPSTQAAYIYPNVMPYYDPRGVHPHDIPSPGVFDEPTVKVCLNTRWASHLTAGIERFIYEDAWRGTEEEIYAAIDAVIKVLAEFDKAENQGRCNVTECCNPAQTNYRQVADGTIEISHDGGVTWETPPESGSPLDPIAYFPPIPGTDGAEKRCKAANSIGWFFKTLNDQYHEALVNEVKAAALAAIFEGILLLIGLAPLAIWSIIATAIGLLVLQKNADDFASEFTEQFWQDLVCAAFNASDAAGIYINTDARQIIDEMKGKYPGYAGEWIEKVLAPFSGKALTNTGSAGFTLNLSCDDCLIVCDLDTWTVLRGDEIAGAPAGHIWVDAANMGDGTFDVLITSLSIHDCCCNVDFTFTGEDPSVIGYIPCGQEKTADNFGFAYTGQATNEMVFRANAAFSIDIFSAANCE